MTENVVYRNIISTIVLLGALWAAQYLLIKATDHRRGWGSEHRQLWRYYIRNIRVGILCVGLVFIWATELKALALSLVAFAVAIIVATKELILCFLGGLLQALNKPFSIGDRIEISVYKGDVIDQNLMTTLLLEVGPGKGVNQYTCREISIPNSVFLSHSVFNESSQSKYVLHSFTLAFSRNISWKSVETQILSKAEELVTPYREEARKAVQQWSKKRRVDVPDLQSRVFVSYHEHDRTFLTVRILAPSKERGQIEQQIVKHLDLQGLLNAH